MKYFALLIGLVIVIGGVWYVLQSQKMATPIEAETKNVALPISDDAPVAPGVEAVVQEVVVRASNFTFDLKEIRVKEGTTVRVLFENTNGTHDFVIDEFNARTKVLKTGEKETVEFVASSKGTFEYYCSVGEHRAMGMKGSFIVE